jgi:hypothetical protein
VAPSGVIAVPTGNSPNLYAGGSVDYLVKIWKKPGECWVDITNNLAHLHGYGDYVYAIWVSPDDERDLVVGTSKGAFISYDAGESWSATLLTEKVRNFVYHPVLDILYAATDSGVYQSKDRGRRWIEMNRGLTCLDILQIDMDIKNGFLFAATSGASVWRLCLPASPLWVGADEIYASKGGMVELLLNACAVNSGRNYLMLGSLTGTKPGTPLPGGSAMLPLNWDPFTELVSSQLNTHTFSCFMGQLDTNGQSVAKIQAPPLLPTIVGTKMYFAYCLDQPIDYASNAVEVRILE